jgi:hypothetical protein
MHLVVRTSDGREHDFVCIDDVCAEPEATEPGRYVMVEHTMPYTSTRFYVTTP